MAGFLVGGFLGSKFILLSAVGLGTVMTIVWSASRSNWSDQSFMTGIWLLWTLIWAIVGAARMSAGQRNWVTIYMTLINVGAFAGNVSSRYG